MSEPLPPEHAPIVHATELEVGREFELDRAGVRALALREVNVKEAFTLRDAGGRYYRATLLATGATGARALAYEKMPGSPESTARIVLGCAVLARQRMLTVMQKATELGVARVVPLLTERSVPAGGLAHEKAHAWPGQVLRAVRQCRRASVPVAHQAERFESFLAGPHWGGAPVGARYYLDDRSAKNTGGVTLPALRSEESPLDVALAVGPEGGFTDAERRALEDHQGTPLRLGGRVLRAETAVLVGLALLQHLLGDLR